MSQSKCIWLISSKHHKTAVATPQGPMGTLKVNKCSKARLQIFVRNELFPSTEMLKGFYLDSTESVLIRTLRNSEMLKEKCILL